MTVLIAWASLSVGIVIGAAWKALCEKQSRRNTSLEDGSMAIHRMQLDPRTWHRQLDRLNAGTHRQAS
jgi:hypothetical protein